MTTDNNCQSCSMPIESGQYCQYCTDGNGALMPFEETLERMMQFARKRESAISSEEAKAKTLAFMATMPAWADHPSVRAASS